jgi:hypothetical protein
MHLRDLANVSLNLEKELKILIHLLPMRKKLKSPRHQHSSHHLNSLAFEQQHAVPLHHQENYPQSAMNLNPPSLPPTSSKPPPQTAISRRQCRQGIQPPALHLHNSYAPRNVPEITLVTHHHLYVSTIIPHLSDLTPREHHPPPSSVNSSLSHLGQFVASILATARTINNGVFFYRARTSIYVFFSSMDIVGVYIGSVSIISLY